jgi:protein tyrosine phosphatase (PTP) superfamily phosphohydrolase (DUF442 family)
LRWLILSPLLIACLGAGGYYIYVRFVTTNFNYVVRGEVYRSAQPSPGQLEAWIPKYGLKTIINMRGESFSDFPGEMAVARQLGVTVINISLPSSQMAKSPQLMRLAEAIETAERPILLHCREGADRSGLASVMARMAIGGKTYARSREQLDIRFLHIDATASHVTAVLQEYEDYCRAQGTGTGGWKEFRQWLFNVYRPSYCYVVFDVTPELTVRPGEEMHFKVRFENRSRLAIPAGDPQKKFVLLVSAGGSQEEKADLPLPDPVPLPRKDIPPGGEVTMEVRLPAPAQAGQYELQFDLREEGEEAFRHQGSAPGVCRLTVTK